MQIYTAQLFMHYWNRIGALPTLESVGIRNYRLEEIVGMLSFVSLKYLKNPEL